MRFILQHSLKRLSERFQNFHYKLPSDPEQIMMDFYFITFILGSKVDDDDINFVIEETEEVVVESVYNHILKALKFALASEFRHVFRYADSRDNEKFVDFFNRHAQFLTIYAEKHDDISFSQNDEFMKKLKNGGMLAQKRQSPIDIEIQKRVQKYDVYFGNDRNREDSFKSVLYAQKKARVSNYRFGEITLDAFYLPYWGNSGYGGLAWTNISEAYMKLLSLKGKSAVQKSIWIDHAYDLVHNTDTVFNKIRSYSKGHSSYTWIVKALDWKRDVIDIRDYFSAVSPQLRPIVAYIAYNVFGLAMDDPTVVLAPHEYDFTLLKKELEKTRRVEVIWFAGSDAHLKLISNDADISIKISSAFDMESLTIKDTRAISKEIMSFIDRLILTSNTFGTPDYWDVVLFLRKQRDTWFDLFHINVRRLALRYPGDQIEVCSETPLTLVDISNSPDIGEDDILYEV